MRVIFKRPADTVYQAAPAQTCKGGSLTFLIAGMRVASQYTIQHQLTSAAGKVTYGPALNFTTGTPGDKFPALKVALAPNSQTNNQAGMLLQGFVANQYMTAPPALPIATDLNGNLLWYYDPGNGEAVTLTRPLAGGDLLVLTGTSDVKNTLREIDLAGDKIRETNVTNISAQLTARGFQPILDFNHEAIRLPNGSTAILAHDERLYTNVQGPGTVDVLGDMVIVLDQNFNVTWAWDGFDHLDVSRAAVLGEVCYVGLPTNPCPPLVLAQQANDWLHANCIYYNSSDGSFMVSLRNQDWIVKIDYGNGAGTGNVLWRLGNQGDFTMLNTPNISSPWFSHQHDAQFDPYGGPGVLSLLDNGNTRVVANPTVATHSRGQVLRIDETRKTADIVLSADLGAYSKMLGSAQRLSNGNYHFLLGAVVQSATTWLSRDSEILPTGSAAGTNNYALQGAAQTYRSFRMSDMYTPQLPTTTPIAKAGASRTVNPGLVQLDGSASNDPSGLPLTYAWSLAAKPVGSAAVISGASGVKPTFIADRAGSYTVRLTVGNGTQTSPPAGVTFSTVNFAPVANAGSSQSVGLNSPVMLNGSASSDANGDPLTYSWFMNTRPAGSSAILTGASSVTPGFTPDYPGSYGFQLTVMDPAGASGMASVTITAVAYQPEANPGVSQTVNVASMVALNGAASVDPNGLPLTYAWSLVSKPSQSGARLMNASTAGAGFFADRPGQYTVQLVVSDVFLSSLPAILTITSNDVPPVANAGSNQTVTAGTVVQLDGSQSTGLGGNPLTFLWTLIVPAGSAAALSNPAAVTPVFLADVPGDYTAQLTVNDGYFDSSPATTAIGTDPVPPAAKAGNNQTVRIGASAMLDGSGSTDPGGRTLTYAWSFVSAPSGAAAVLSDPSSLMPTFVTDLAGDYVVQLIVDDGLLSSLPAAVTITSGNVAPVAHPGPAQTVLPGAVVALDGSRSTDANGDSLIYSWSLTSVPAGSAAVLSDPSSIDPIFTADVPGNYLAQLLVTDGKQNSLPATVTISTVGVPPISNAGPRQMVTVGAPVTADGSASSDPNGYSLAYRWSFVAIPSGSAAVLAEPGAASTTFVADVPGNYVLQLVVGDPLLNSAPSTVAISTNPIPPAANAGSAQSVVAGSMVAVDGSGSTSGSGGPLQYRWAILSKPAGSAAVLSDPGAVTPHFVADLDGFYAVQLIVNDGSFDSAPATVLIGAR